MFNLKELKPGDVFQINEEYYTAVGTDSNLCQCGTDICIGKNDTEMCAAMPLCGIDGNFQIFLKCNADAFQSPGK